MITSSSDKGIERIATVWPEGPPVYIKGEALFTRAGFKFAPPLGGLAIARRSAFAALTAAVTRDKGGMWPVLADVTHDDDMSTRGVLHFGYPDDPNSKTLATIDQMKKSIETALPLLSPGEGLEIEFRTEDPSVPAMV